MKQHWHSIPGCSGVGERTEGESGDGEGAEGEGMEGEGTEGEGRGDVRSEELDSPPSFEGSDGRGLNGNEISF